MALCACGSSTSSTSTHSASARSATTTASTPATTATTATAATTTTPTTTTAGLSSPLVALDKACAAAIPASLSPPAGPFPTSSEFNNYRDAADAAFKALLPGIASGKASATLSEMATSVEGAGGDFYDASKLSAGAPGAADLFTRATTSLILAANDAATLGMSACSNALTRLNNVSSGHP